MWRGLLFLVAATSLSAQERTTIRGIVLDSLGKPVESVQIQVLLLRTMSDSAGQFALAGVPVGNATLLARRIGFAPRSLPLQITTTVTDSIRLVMIRLPQELTTVTADATRGRLGDFYRHRENGQGSYFDRAEIEKLRPARLSDVARRVPGVRLQTDRSGRQQLRMSRASGGRDCPPDYYVDGIRAPFLTIDDVPIPDVEAIEVYKGASTVPPEYITRFGNPSCGVIVIWTRVPG